MQFGLGKAPDEGFPLIPVKSQGVPACWGYGLLIVVAWLLTKVMVHCLLA
jgi:hypothetical protein